MDVWVGMFKRLLFLFKERFLQGIFWVLISSIGQASEDSFYDHVMRALGAKTDVVVLAKIEDPLLRARVKHRDQVIRQRRDIQIQFAEDRRLDHDLLKPLNKLIEDLEGQRALVEYYEQYRRDLLTLPLADLFRPEIQCFGRHPFLVEERCIRDVILKDVYGKNLRREGQAGHHTVSNFGGIHFKVNGHPPLRPGLEQAMYGFHKRAFGGGIVSSRLLWVKNVHVKRFNVDVIRKKRADDPERAEFEILKELYGEFRGNEDHYAGKVPPKSPIGNAIAYSRNNWPELTRYLDDGRLEIDNNATERCIRPFALGRRNWLFMGHPKSAQASANIYSLIETCKSHNLNPYYYMKDVCDKLAKPKIDLSTLISLLPYNWKPPETNPNQKSPS